MGRGSWDTTYRTIISLLLDSRGRGTVAFSLCTQTELASHLSPMDNSQSLSTQKLVGLSVSQNKIKQKGMKVGKGFVVRVGELIRSGGRY